MSFHDPPEPSISFCKLPWFQWIISTAFGPLSAVLRHTDRAAPLLMLTAAAVHHPQLIQTMLADADVF